MNKNFIAATREYCRVDKHVAAPYLRRSFELSSKPSEAKISICGLGFYILYVNGINVTKGHMAPYISNPDHICYYDTYDITEHLVAGENVIGIILGNGFMNCLGGMIWDFDKAEFRGAPRVALELDCKGGFGEVKIIADEKFLTHPSPLLFDDLRLGETYDARLDIPGWNLPGFDADGWSPAILADIPRGVLKKCNAEPITALREIKPICIKREGNDFVYDFGVNSAGICRLSVKGEPGQMIELWHGETLREGKFYNGNIIFEREKAYQTYNQTDRFICSGGDDVYSPSFRYNGFRYVKVVGMTESQATEDALTFIVMSSDIPVIGGFECSDERINTLYRMVDNANRSNFYYYPTDCPHREKNGWTGDASMSSDQMILQYDCERSWREWLHNIRCAQNARGELPGIVPTAGWGFAWGNGPTWDSVLFNLPYMLYKFRGCTDVVIENAHAMVRYLEYAMTRRSADGTIAIGLGDWVPEGKAADAYDAPLALTDSVMVMDMARKAAEMLDAVGYTHQASFAKGIFEDMRSTVRRELVDLDSMLVKGDCQSSQAIALYYGVFEEDEREPAFSHLLRQIHRKDDAFDCGFIGMHCIFHVLSDFGEGELAFRMITRDKYPSYTHLIDLGQTALPEHFLPDDVRFMESYNHHFLGDISRWFTTWIAGLNVIDYKTIRLTPMAVCGITHASAWYDLPAGRVSVKWHIGDDGKMRLDVETPAGVTIVE